MKSLYLRLAAGNIKNNRRFYLPFLLTAVMTVACFFILCSVGLSQTLPGGQKQRAAAARALITDPRLILADEPTGALDSKSTDELLRLFEAVNREGQTIVMVTHSVKAASHAGRVLFIKDGEVFHQLYRGSATDEALYQKISDTLTVLATGGEQE